jgi:small subunit ribosomal protein S16e
MVIAKGNVAWNKKYVDEEQKATVLKNFMNHDKTLLVVYNRRMESKKYGGPGARTKYQKSYR